MILFTVILWAAMRTRKIVTKSLRYDTVYGITVGNNEDLRISYSEFKV